MRKIDVRYMKIVRCWMTDSEEKEMFKNRHIDFNTRFSSHSGILQALEMLIFINTLA
jgi:hypothetical protein